MNKAQPSGNRHLENKWHQMRLQKHYERINNLKPNIPNKAPKKYDFLQNKAKKVFSDRLRSDQIERDNAQLLDRMQSIRNSVGAKSPRPFKLRSLNRDHRRQEITRITQENQALLKRLQMSSPFLSSSDWKRDYKKNKLWMKNMCQFPYALGKPHLRKCVSETGMDTVVSTMDKAVVFKRGMNINDTYILTEVNYENGEYVITGYNVENPKTYSINLSKEEVEEIIGEEKDYDKLCSQLTLEEDTLVLVKSNTEEKELL